jgi:hypothetical protein
MKWADSRQINNRETQQVYYVQRHYNHIDVISLKEMADGCSLHSIVGSRNKEIEVIPWGR